MQTILVAIKDPHKRRIVVQSVHEVRPDVNIREVATLEDIPQLVRVVRPEVLITTLDTQRHSTLRLLDDLHLQCPQVNSVVLCGVDDFEIVRSAATRAGAVDFILAPLQLSDLSRVLQNIDVRIHALREAGAAMPLIARPEPSPEQREAERSFAEWITGGQSEAALEELCCGVPQGPSFLLCAQGEGVPGERARHTEHLGEWFSSYLGAANCLLLARDEAHGLLWALLFPAGERGSEWVRDRLDAAAAHMRYSEGLSMSVGVSGAMEDIARELSPAAEQAHGALTYRFFTPPDQTSITLFEDLLPSASADIPYLHTAEEALYAALCSRSMGRIEEEAERLFSQLGAWPRPRPARVMRYVNRLVQQLLFRAGDDGVLSPGAVRRGTAQAPALFGACERLCALKGCVLTVLRSALKD